MSKTTEADPVGKAIVDAWNSQHLIGSYVIVVQDDGSQLVTKTRSIAWCLGNGDPVIKYKGRTDGYSLARVIPMSAANADPITVVDRPA